MKLQIKIGNLARLENSNHELARLASVYAMPPHLREHDTAGEQLPRHFPRQHPVHDPDKPDAAPKMFGLESEFWNPMQGEFTPAKRIQELETAKALIDMEIARLKSSPPPASEPLNPEPLK